MDRAEIPDIIERYRDAPFQWGELDCCLFAANVVRDLTGVDYAEAFRGEYEDEEGAKSLISGYGSLEALLDANLPSPQSVLRARRGDFLLAPVPDPALGVCAGQRGVFKGFDGLVAVPLRLCTRSWSCLLP